MSMDLKDPVEYAVGDWVEKGVGEARYKGHVAAVYAAAYRGGVRYVVEVWPQGFQMICTGGMLAKSTPETWPS